MTVKELIDAAMVRARERGAEATPWDARVLLAHALGGRNPLALDPRAAVEPHSAARFESLWWRRVAGVPTQFLVGEWDFYGRPYTVDERGLIPRPETEVLVASALAEAPLARSILDVGTGSGIIAATLLLERQDAHAVALDISLAALALARLNQRRHGLADRLSLAASDWLSALGSVRFDLAVSNPPYLGEPEEKELAQEIRDHEPRVALFGGEDGLDGVRWLLDTLSEHLEPDAPFLFEVGFGQADAATEEILHRPQWRFVRADSDLAGIPRVVIARRAVE